MNRMLFACLVLFLCVWVTPSTASEVPPPLPGVPVEILNADGSLKARWEIDVDNAGSGMTLAVADLGTDGTQELILGAGMGNAPEVLVYDMHGGKIGGFLAYAPDAGVGVNVIACDVTGDGIKEILTAPQRGGGPHIRLFSNFGTAIDNGGFMAFDAQQRTGVNLACGDLDGDGSDELVTLPAPGADPHVKVWTYTSAGMQVVYDWMDGVATDTRGRVGLVRDHVLYLASSHGSDAEIISYTFDTGAPMAGTATPFHASGGGVLSIADLQGAAVPISAGSELHIALGDTDVSGSSAYEGDLDQDGTNELVLVPTRPAFTTQYPEGKAIIIDLSQQRLFAYEDGVFANTFLISSARAPYTTPVGEHRVLAKLPYVHYMWSYGEGNPNNYDLGLVPWNLRIYPHIYIHYAPWHNNFGRPMSHGCINVNLTNIKWVYDWSDEGIPVRVQE